MATVAIECALLFAIVSRRAFVAVCALMCFFHLGVALLFQITFTPNLMAYAAFVDWRPRTEHGPLAHSVRWLSTRTRAECGIAIVGAIATLLLAGNPILWASGMRQLSKISSVVSLARIPSLFSFLPAAKPGVSRSTINAVLLFLVRGSPVRMTRCSSS